MILSVASRLTPRYLDDHFETYGWPDRGDGPTWAPALSVVVMIAVCGKRVVSFIDGHLSESGSGLGEGEN